jgi:hypothetical protein
MLVYFQNILISFKKLQNPYCINKYSIQNEKQVDLLLLFYKKIKKDLVN